MTASHDEPPIAAWAADGGVFTPVSSCHSPGSRAHDTVTPTRGASLPRAVGVGRREHGRPRRCRPTDPRHDVPDETARSRARERRRAPVRGRTRIERKLSGAPSSWRRRRAIPRLRATRARPRGRVDRRRRGEPRPRAASTARRRDRRRRRRARSDDPARSRRTPPCRPPTPRRFRAGRARGRGARPTAARRAHRRGAPRTNPRRRARRTPTASRPSSSGRTRTPYVRRTRTRSPTRVPASDGVAAGTSATRAPLSACVERRTWSPLGRQPGPRAAAGAHAGDDQIVVGAHRHRERTHLSVDDVRLDGPRLPRVHAAVDLEGLGDVRGHTLARAREVERRSPPAEANVDTTMGWKRAASR